jgi:hypothetical protein
MRSFIAILLLLTGSSLTHAALDPELKTPYLLKVVLKFADHPHFTPHFRAEFKKDLQGTLQSSLGSLGNVEVIDIKDVAPKNWPSHWKLVEEKGLHFLESFGEITGYKTHFVHIDYADGTYHLQARQHDGSTGFVTPVIRKNKTQDRAFVSRLAGLMIGQDFGIVASFDPPKGNDTFSMQFRGSGLNVEFEKWVKKGDVFAIMQIRQIQSKPTKGTGKEPAKAPPPVTVGARMDGILIQTSDDPKGGTCSSSIYYRYEDPLPVRGSVLGYRSIKIGTTEAPLKLQLVDANGNPHKIANLQVRVHHERFPDQPNDGQDAPLKNGVFESKRKFSNVALVRITLGDRALARIPIEICDDRVIVKQIRIEPGSEIRGRLEVARRDAMSRITDARLMQSRLIQDLVVLEQGNKKQEALQRAERTYKVIESDSAELKDELNRLKTRAQRELPNVSDFVKDCDQQLVLLSQKQTELAGHINQLKEAIKIENDPAVQARRKKAQESIRQAELLVSQAEIDQAITKYEEAIKEIEEPNAKSKVQMILDNLKKAWELKDDTHKQARQFFYETWPQLDTAQAIGEQLPTARQSFEKLKAVNDRLTMNKILLGSTELVNKVVAQIQEIGEPTEEEQTKQLMALKKLGEDLEKFLSEVGNAVK